MKPSAPYRVVVKTTAAQQLRTLPVTAFVGVRRVLDELSKRLGEGLHAVEGALHHLELAGRVAPGCRKLTYAVDSERRTMFVVELAR